MKFENKKFSIIGSLRFDIKNILYRCFKVDVGTEASFVNCTFTLGRRSLKNFFSSLPKTISVLEAQEAFFEKPEYLQIFLSIIPKTIKEIKITPYELQLLGSKGVQDVFSQKQIKSIALVGCTLRCIEQSALEKSLSALPENISELSLESSDLKHLDIGKLQLALPETVTTCNLSENLKAAQVKTVYADVSKHIIALDERPEGDWFGYESRAL